MEKIRLVMAIIIFVFATLGIFDIYIINDVPQNIFIGAFFVLLSKDMEKSKTRTLLIWLGYLVIILSLVRLFINVS